MAIGLGGGADLRRCAFYADGRPGCDAAAAYEAVIRWAGETYVHAVCLGHTDAVPGVVEFRRLDAAAPERLVRRLRVVGAPAAALAAPAETILPPRPAARGSAPRVRAPHPRIPYPQIPHPRILHPRIPGLRMPRLCWPSARAVLQGGVAFFVASLIFSTAMLLTLGDTNTVSADPAPQAAAVETP